jgi:subtilisin family serine protease
MFVIGLAAISGAAWAADPSVNPRNNGADPVAPVIGENDWRVEWRKDRNALIDANPNLPSDPTSILVQFKADADDDSKNVMRQLINGRTIETFDLTPGLEHIAIGDGAAAKIDVLNTLGRLVGAVAYAEPDYTYHLYATPNDTYWSLLWGMHNTGQTVAGDPGVNDADIDAAEAWNIVTTSTLPIAVCDSGLRRTHQDISGNLWTNPGEIAGNGVDDDGNGRIDDTQGWDFYFNDNDPNDGNGHGTHVAGTIGGKGNNGVGVAGVNWNCKLVSLRIANASGSISSSAAISAINYCVGKGIRLSNHSWGGGAYSSSMFNTINAARTAGHLVIAAAGNGGADGVGDNNNVTPQYPASYNLDNIISVAAMNNDWNRASFSNYGSTSVDLAAPGVLTASCYNSSNTSYVYLDGTSMATPHVTGVAALVWTRYPTWTYAQVRSRIFSSVTPRSNWSGVVATGGVLNANGAVQ